MNIKRTSLFILLASMFLSVHPANAQFLKKLFKKDKNSSNSSHQKLQLNYNSKGKPSKKDQHIEYPESKLKERYRVDVLVPLYLNELVQNNSVTFKGKLPDKAVFGVNFYEGIQLAADSLKKLGYKMDLYIHDVASPEMTPEKLIAGKVLDSSNLIIGAVPTNQVAKLAQYAKKLKINFISSLSPSDGGVKDNPYFTLLQSSLRANCEWVQQAVQKKYPKQKITIYSHTASTADDNAFRYVQGDNVKGFQKVNCNVLPTREQLIKLFDSSNVNVIVMPVLDNSYAESLLKQLYTFFPTYKFEVYGMPTWSAIPSIRKTGVYPNVTVIFPIPFYFDRSAPVAKDLAEAYDKEFGGKPNDYVFRGYEILFWYADLLKKYGTVFNNNYTDNANAIFTHYTVKPEWDAAQNLLYNENQHLYFYRYQNGSYLIAD